MRTPLHSILKAIRAPMTSIIVSSVLAVLLGFFMVPGVVTLIQFCSELSAVLFVSQRGQISRRKYF